MGFATACYNPFVWLGRKNTPSTLVVYWDHPFQPPPVWVYVRLNFLNRTLFQPATSGKSPYFASYNHPTKSRQCLLFFFNRFSQVWNRFDQPNQPQMRKNPNHPANQKRLIPIQHGLSAPEMISNFFWEDWRSSSDVRSKLLLLALHFKRSVYFLSIYIDIFLWYSKKGKCFS